MPMSGYQWSRPNPTPATKRSWRDTWQNVSAYRIVSLITSELVWRVQEMRAWVPENPD
jgi:hypothetical protein